jgi:hypothetical protein
MLSGGVRPAEDEMQQQSEQPAVMDLAQATQAHSVPSTCPADASAATQAAPERARCAAPPACTQAGANCGPQRTGLSLTSAAAPLAPGSHAPAHLPCRSMDGVVRIVHATDVEGLVGRRRLAHHLQTREVRSPGCDSAQHVHIHPGNNRSHGSSNNAGWCCDLRVSAAMAVQGCRLLLDWLWHVERVGPSQAEYLPLGLGHHGPVLKTIVSEVATALQATPEHPYSQRAVLQSIRACPLLEQVPHAP